MGSIYSITLYMKYVKIYEIWKMWQNVRLGAFICKKEIRERTPGHPSRWGGIPYPPANRGGPGPPPENFLKIKASGHTFYHIFYVFYRYSRWWKNGSHISEKFSSWIKLYTVKPRNFFLQIKAQGRTFCHIFNIHISYTRWWNKWIPYQRKIQLMNKKHIQ